MTQSLQIPDDLVVPVPDRLRVPWRACGWALVAAVASVLLLLPQILAGGLITVLGLVFALGAAAWVFKVVASLDDGFVYHWEGRFGRNGYPAPVITRYAPYPDETTGEAIVGHITVCLGCRRRIRWGEDVEAHWDHHPPLPPSRPDRLLRWVVRTGLGAFLYGPLLIAGGLFLYVLAWGY